MFILVKWSRDKAPAPVILISEIPGGFLVPGARRILVFLGPITHFGFLKQESNAQVYQGTPVG